jgi:DNA-binding transcriptional MocR family regulator
MYVSGLLQAAALDVVTQPGWATHLRGMRQQLRIRRNRLLEAVNTHAPALHVEHVPRGGLNLWARLPDGSDVPQFARDCEARGLIVAPGSEWFPAEPSGPFIRLNFSAEDPERFPEAAHILGETVGPTSEA